ncbi:MULTISPECIES: D-alanyl-D-alanine carboxypeptidase/D-alanyl-D-alanine endopeptidase [Nonomuraea]|uniref:D-alanyl-D-alanine carboxypeptidase/D-alanyl-D-alanine-endopeptidase n=1 Tax=Nonomuraea ferruginea TaxID=46174 RepID=A0ABT4SUC3_9ACTN|nr:MULTISPECIES: D-alanyl-D-alanine carboxypeptidase/D-alanyl-D-alanine-endopeptidase [Nonomuraea]MDA0640868.1 D-alanyl-D-alanine carboxypeptidase/D-alanyl-D-alanine-endopeptidase [Nonomuraea ferruginea]TXK34613.1 D-alanyl-D-alanine carboxypeptidase/D-alanyl-D-alanine-endopeptidase [Nonomuraea sp. C10]
MARHERWVMLTTLVLLQVVTIVTGVYAVDNDLTLSALTRQPPPAEPTAPPEVPVVTAGPVLAGLAARPGDGPLPTKGTLTRRLTDALGDRALGDRVGAVVVDASTGERVFAANPDAGIVPASTTKVVTSVAALASLGPDTRLATRVVQGGAPGAIVLVGGGDPLLAGPRAKPGSFTDQASMTTLAARTAAALKQRGVAKVTLSYDASLFTGPDVGPGWKPGYIPDGHVARVHALAIDEGRQNPGQNSPRVADPSRHAADAFAGLLKKKGITVAKTVEPARAPAGAAELAKVESAPVYALVEHALTYSDNDLSEALARHVAIKEGQPGSFAGVAKAVPQVLQRVGAGGGIQVYDGSGLSTRNRISAGAMAGLIALAVSPDRPGLHAVASGMPIAGFTGTLGNGRRFTGADSKGQVGLVRAKTGTLNNVSTLAGLTTSKDGRVLAFAFMADKVPVYAEPVLDRLAAIVARA